MWIAFKLFNFDLLKQPMKCTNFQRGSCELLSNYLILTCWNSPIKYIKPWKKLWIAFKLFNFDLLKQRQMNIHLSSTSCELLSNYLILTCWNSSNGEKTKRNELWIAFKLFNFDLLKQHTGVKEADRACCELLSNYLILTCWNSTNANLESEQKVVNCFQTI